ncbi:MAG: tRNA dihydrouridine synthase DusB [Mariprofundaceae bacterium]
MCTIPSQSLPGFHIGPHHVAMPLALAPMAGITDLPFRRICKRFGAGITVTEMIASRAIDQGRERTERMAEIGHDEHPVGIQIAGADPQFIRDAARWAENHGADFVDINMGCPVKKICKQIAGSALLKDEPRVARILDAAVAAVRVPVTLKIRTGWDAHSKNVERIAKIAEASGIAMLTVHGRTRAQMFNGHADWEDIGLAKQAVRIPVLGNGDIVDAASALEMLRIAGCDGIMVGRAVQGNPWLLGEISAALSGKSLPASADNMQRWDIVYEHLTALHAHHGEHIASKLARKHVAWYSKGCKDSAEFRQHFQRISEWSAQVATARAFFTGDDAEQGWLRAA